MQASVDNREVPSGDDKSNLDDIDISETVEAMMDEIFKSDRRLRNDTPTH